METQKVIDEFNELKKKLKDFYNQCYANALIHTNEYRNSTFGFDNDKLYVSLSYLLNNFEHQNKLFYNYLVKNNLYIFNINVICLDHGQTLGFLNYRINDKFINYDLLFEVVDEFYAEDETNDNWACIDFMPFYASYLLQHPEKYDVNNCRMSCAVSDFIYSICRMCLKSIDTNDNGPTYARENFFTTDSNDQIISEKQYPLFLNNRNPTFYDNPNSFFFTKSTYLSKIDNNSIMMTSSLPFNELYNSFDGKTACIRNHINILSIVDDILKNISFNIIDKNIDKISQMISNQTGPFNYYQRIRSIVETVLLATTTYIDNAAIFESHLKDALNEVDENMQNQQWKNGSKYEIKKWCSSFFIKQNKFDDLNSLCHLSKKFLTEMPNFIEKMEIDYTPSLVKLII